MTMPNFLIIGANKAGTSSLYAYLNQHPEIYMSPVKEPMFFNFNDKKINTTRRYQKKILKDAVNNIEDYQALFQGVSSEKAIGEASTSYLHCSEAAEEIKKYIPDVKIIAILRDPVERAYSNYLMYFRWGVETIPDFALAVREEENRIRNNYPMGWYYTKLGFYYESLKHYLEVFAPNQFKIYLYEDWNNNSNEVLRDIFQFLGVDETFVPNISVRHNSAAIPKNKHIDSFIKKPNILKNLVKSLIPAQLRRSLRDKIEKQNLGKPSLSPHVRQELINIYREDILKLQDLIHRDLSKWLQ